MPLSPAVIDREYNKFVETGDGKTAVRTLLSNGFVLPKFDEFEVTYPSSTQEVYDFKLATVTVATVTLNYTNATKEFLLNGALT